MKAKHSIWFWRGVWVLGLAAGCGLFLLYSWLPADGATGDLESFAPEGFRVQWLLQDRTDGLQVDDIIVRGGGHTLEEWLEGAPRGPEWQTGGTVLYEILRDGQPVALQIRLSPVPFVEILNRWSIQLLVALALLLLGTYVFWKRPHELPARLLMLFCLSMALQYWGDAYNFQYATLPWQWPFWFQRVYEHITYSISVASVCYFALVFPAPHPLLRRFPHLVPLVLYLVIPLTTVLVMAFSPDRIAALSSGNSVAWILSLPLLALTFAAGIRSIRTASDPVTRAQVRWMVWCGFVGVGILTPGYVIPILLFGRPWIPHPVTMLIVALIPFTVAIAVLRYRLFDIDFIINRSLVYGTLTVLLGGVYLFLVVLLTFAVQGGFDQHPDILVAFVATLGTALVFAPLRQRVQNLIDRTFYRSKLDYQRLLPEMSEKLAGSIVLDQLAGLLTDEFPQRLQIAWAVLAVLEPEGERFVLPGSGNRECVLTRSHPLAAYLQRRGRPLIRLQPPDRLPPGAQHFLDENAIELTIPLIAGGELVGVYNLGPKLSGDGYGSDEVRILQILGQQAAVAVENSRLFQAEQHQRRMAETLLEEKEVLLKEIHHRVKNNLQVISSLLYLQSKQVEDTATLDMFLESQHRVRSMALLHERLYQAQDLARIDYGEYVRDLVFFLKRSYGSSAGSVELQVVVGEVSLDIEQAVPCGLIINELVSNSLKYAFPAGREGRVWVQFDMAQEGTYTLVVGDDGVGLPQDLDFRSTQSLGLRLVNTLVNQLEGTIDLVAVTGTEFTVRFNSSNLDGGN